MARRSLEDRVLTGPRPGIELGWLFAGGRELLLTVAPFVLGIVFAVIWALLRSTVGGAKGRFSFVVAFVALLCGTFLTMVFAIVFGCSKGTDRCPRCDKRQRYYKADAKRGLVCKSCGEHWPAGTSPAIPF